MALKTNATGGQATDPNPLRAGFAGLLAGAAALSVGELAGAVAAPRPGPVVAVANRVVDKAPSWFVDFGKAVFSLNDKPALVLGTVIISLLFAIGLGIASIRRPMVGIAGIIVFGLIGLLSIATDSQGTFGHALWISALAVGAGIATLLWLLDKAYPNGRSQTTTIPLSESTQADDANEIEKLGFPSDRNDEEPTGDETPNAELVGVGSVTDSPTDPSVSRRGFLNAAGLVTVGAAASSVGANFLRSQSSATQARNNVAIQTPDGVTIPSGVDATGATVVNEGVAATPNITPLFVPNDKFYRIDTAILTPQVDPADWTLRITGMVDQELTLTFEELQERASEVKPVTLSCVSNEVGGTLVGNALWQGVPLVELLDEAGVQEGATQIASRSVDGWTCGFPTAAAYDGRTAMVAIAMNNEPLPLEHGFPARLVVSGLYGYVSATKWLAEIGLTTLEGFEGYWIPRGWSKLGPIKTQSRIDTPGHGSTFTAGQKVPIAGVAWAPDTGIEAVEVQIDDGEWMEAELGESLGPDAWVQWVLPWEANQGRHDIRVRATDTTGETQTPDRAAPAPNGASGWHTVAVSVT